MLASRAIRAYDPQALFRFISYLRSAGLYQYGIPIVAVVVAALLRERPVDVLVSDLGMPGADGFDLIRCVRRPEDHGGRPQLPAVALTAYASAEDRQRALAAGYDAHVAKPMDVDDAGAAGAAESRIIPTRSGQT